MVGARRSVRRWSSVWAAVVCLAAVTAARAEVRLPAVISDHMVLQRGIPLPIWGWADPGEEVTVLLEDARASAVADAEGRWTVKLPAREAGGPLELVVSGRNEVRVRDVLVGEVWVASGQSNMAWPVSRAENADKEIADAQYPQIRLLTVPQKLAGEPADNAAIEWVVCSPKTVPAFSAVAYFFGRDIHRELKVPVGLLNTSWGGTAIEPWTPLEGFAAIPELTQIKARVEDARATYRGRLTSYLDQTGGWLKAAQATVRGGGVPTSAPAWPQHPLLDAGRAAPTAMYNAMVSPLMPLAIRGAIWYQGENNTSAGDTQYFEKMKALISGWRQVWGQGDFPFYFVQLAPYKYTTRPRGSRISLPRTWEQQCAALSIPNTGMAVITDVATLNDIHPKNKQDVGKRLAAWAMAGPYGRKDVMPSGPLFSSMSLDGAKARIRFDYADGLRSRDGKALTWFQVAGEDRNFVDARAEIDGDTVVVRSDSVEKPVAVRFGWSEEANPNLVNATGFPASPFRTDRW